MSFRKATINHIREEENGHAAVTSTNRPQSITADDASPELTTVIVKTSTGNGVAHPVPEPTTFLANGLTETEPAVDESKGLYEEVDITSLRIQNQSSSLNQTGNTIACTSHGDVAVASHASVSRKTSADGLAQDTVGVFRPAHSALSIASGNPMLPPRNTDSIFVGAHPSGGAGVGTQTREAVTSSASGNNSSGGNKGNKNYRMQ